jgi:hypothetical protein
MPEMIRISEAQARLGLKAQTFRRLRRRLDFPTHGYLLNWTALCAVLNKTTKKGKPHDVSA